MKKVINFVLKLVVSSVLLVLFLSRLDLHAVSKVMRQIEIPLYLCSFSVYLATVFVSSKRWSLFLPGRLSYMKLVSLYFIGSFFNTFLPGIIGGDTVKTYYLYRQTGEAGLAMAAIFMDRYMGLIAMAWIGLLGLVFGYSFIKNNEILWLLLIFLGGIAAGSLFFWKINWGRIQLLRTFHASIMQFKQKKAVMAQGLALGVIIQGMNIASVYLLSLALGLNVSLLYFLMFIPIISLLSAIPVSMAGLGIREAGFIMLFPQAGITAEEALSLSLLVFTTMCLVSFIGGLEYLRLGKIR